MKNSAFENFNESTQNVLDFARCQRADGSYYGTGGQCRKGSPAGAKEKSGGDTDVKQLRKDMIAARDAERAAKAKREAAAKGDDKKAAAEARRAHIDSKKEMKAAAQRFKDAQAKAGDVRRFGRDDERSKASTEELTNALRGGRLSPTKAAAVEREISTRLSRAKQDVDKRLKTATGDEARKLRGQRADIEEARNKLRYASKGLGGAQSRLTGKEVRNAVGTVD